ncbi:MAG: 2-C-methyl-D-erythritol 4-phosphate cytidylyltransferase [Bacteroidales bacterium]
MQQTIILVAGGRGTRMNSALPKQFIPIGEIPVIIHTLLNFYSYSQDFSFIIALPDDLSGQFREMTAAHCPQIKYLLGSGGETRFHTVKNALKLVKTPGLIAVHDAVRPLVSHPVIDRCLAVAAREGAAIPVLEVNESMRWISPEGHAPLDRSRCRLVQTPQVFKSDILFRAYEQEYNELFTDDSSVVEAAGFPVSLVEGNRENIKITTPGDLALATYYLKAK